MNRMLPLLLTACVVGPGNEQIVLEADFDRFVEEVQPILSSTCANPACHGSGDRPLELYAVHQHRLDPDDVWADTPLTTAELYLNFHRSCGFLLDLDQPKDCELVRKPLSVTAGGLHHQGGDQFNDRDNPDYLAILDWIGSIDTPQMEGPQ